MDLDLHKYLERGRHYFFPEYMPLWFSLAGNISWLCILFGIGLLMTKREKVQHVTPLRRMRRFLARLPRRMMYFNRVGPFVKYALKCINAITRYKLAGTPKEVTIAHIENNSVSTVTLECELQSRGWNIFYVAEYDILYRERASKSDVWTEIKNPKNFFRREKTDRTRLMRIQLKGLKAGTEYEVQIQSRNPKVKTYGPANEFTTYFRPTAQWGFHGDGYRWTQTKEEVNIMFKVPEQTRGRQLTVKTNGHNLFAEISPDEEGYPEKKTLCNNPLFDVIFPESMVWEIEDNELCINLHKRKKFGKWTSVFPGHPQVDPGLLKFFTDADAHSVLMDGPQNLPEGLKDHYDDAKNDNNKSF